MCSNASSAQTPSFDLFLSHAGEDKETIARPLYERLSARGVSIFFDVESFRLGDHSPHVMDYAMQTAPVGVFIMSPEFIAKEWPVRELICFVKRYDRAAAAGNTPPLLIPVFYRLKTRDCRDPAILDTYSTIFLQHGLFKRAMDGRVPLQDVSHALHTAATVWSIENDLGASNRDRPNMASTRESFLHMIQSRILERLRNERPDLADKYHLLERETASQNEPKFEKGGTAPPNPPRLTLDYDSPDTFEGKLKAAVLERSAHKVLAVVAVGRGGVGKSCALRGLNDVSDVQSRFPDGVQFMRLGKDAGIDVLIQEIARVVEATGSERLGSNIRSVKPLQNAVDKARKWFAPYTCLFLVDDVWMANGFDANTFSVLAYMINKDSRLVYTTREKELAEEADKFIHFGPRKTEASRVMFLKHSGMQHCTINKKGNIDAMERILEACVGIPLLLAVTASGVREYFSLLKGPKEDALHLYDDKLQRNPDTMIEGKVTGYGLVRNVTSASMSVLELRWEEKAKPESFPLSIREMHWSLCVLQKQQEVPVSMLRRLWGLREETSALKVMKALHSVAVVDVAIPENKGERSSVLRVHDDILDALYFDTKDEKQRHFKRLLDNYCSGSGDAVESEATMVSGDTDERETRSSGAWFNLKRLRRWISSVNEGEVADELAIVNCTTERKRMEWWNVVDDDEYLERNVCRLLHEAGEYDELIWLLLKPQWIVKRMQTGGVFGVESDISIGKQAVDCSDMERKQEKKRSLGVIAHAVRLSYPVVMENAREAHFQLYGRLVGYSDKCEVTRRFVKEIEEIAERPWLKAKRGFLTAAGGAVLESISVGGYVFMVLKKGNDLRVICERDSALQIVKYNVKYGSRSTTEIAERFQAVAMSNDGQTVVWVDDDGDVKKWDAELSVETVIGQSTASSLCICVSEDSRWVACGLRYTGKVLVWDLLSDDAPREMETEARQDVNCVAVSGSGRKVVCGLRYGAIWIWNMENGEAVYDSLLGHGIELQCLAFSENGKEIASGYLDGSIRVLHADSARCSAVTELGDGVTDVAFDAEDKKILWGSQTGTFGFWKHGDEGAVTTVVGEGKKISYVGVSEEGLEALFGDEDGIVRVWDMKDGQAEIESGGGEDGHDEEIECAAVSADGTRIASGSRDGTIRLWDGESGALLPEALRGHSGAVVSVSLSADGRRLVSGGDDVTVRVWDVRSARAVGEPLRGHKWGVSCVAISANGARAASGGSFGELRVWDTQRGAAVGAPLRGLEHRVTCVGMSDDGARVASASGDKTLLVWDVEAHVATQRFSLRGYPRVVSLRSAGAVVWLGDDGSAHVCSLEHSTCVPHPQPLPPCPWGSTEMELELNDSQHHRLWLGSTDVGTLCRSCKLGFFYQSRRGLRFCQVQQ